MRGAGIGSSSASPTGSAKKPSLIEMPISWSLDDYPHFEFVRTATTVLPGLQSARTVMENWLDEFRYMQKTVDWGVLTYTMHPYVIGRGYRMLAFEELVKSLIAAGAVFMTMEDAAAEAQEQGCSFRPHPEERSRQRRTPSCAVPTRFSRGGIESPRGHGAASIDWRPELNVGPRLCPPYRPNATYSLLHGGPLATCITRASRSMSTAPVVIVRLALGWLGSGWRQIA